MRSDEEIERVVGEFYTSDRVRSELAPAGPSWGGWLVAESDAGEVIGAGAGGLTAAGVGEVFVLYVDQGRQRQGAGGALLDAITAQQLAEGAREQWVSVEEGNPKGIPFYERHGFEPAGRREAFGMSGESLRYRRPLTQPAHATPASPPHRRS